MWLSRVLEIEPLLVRKRQFLIIKHLLGVKVNMIYCNLTIFFDVHSGQKRMWSNSPFLVDVSSFFILFFIILFVLVDFIFYIGFCQSGCGCYIETLVIYIVTNWNTENLHFHQILVEIHFIWVLVSFFLPE